MKDSKPRRWGWRRIGGSAIAAILGLLLLWAIVLVGSALVHTRSEQVEQRVLEHNLDPVVGGRVVLDFAVGHFIVQPGEPGEPLRVEAEYDVNSYALEVHVDPSDGDGWVYRVKFREIGWLPDGGLRGLFGGAYPEVRVYLPRDVPFALEGHFGKGVTSVELGGLWLTGIDLDTEKGAAEVSIGEPLVDPVQIVRIRSSQGSLKTRSLGNASPRELTINSRLGRVSVDLRGRWLNDAEVLVRSVIGRTELTLPRDVRVEGLSGHGLIVGPQDLELPPPTLRVSVSRFMGGLSVVD